MKKRLLAVGLALVLAAAVWLPVHPTLAAGPIISITPNADNLFLRMSGMLPGEVRKESFTVTNVGGEDYHFYLQAASATELDFPAADALQSCEEMLAALEMTVTVHGGSSVVEYSGKANLVDCHDDYVAMVGRLIQLGRLAPGQQVRIDAEVYVPPEVDNLHVGVEGKFWWNFYATDDAGFPQESLPTPKPGPLDANALATPPGPATAAPQTGDGARLLLWALLLGLGGVLLVLAGSLLRRHAPPARLPHHPNAPPGIAPVPHIDTHTPKTNPTQPEKRKEKHHE